MSRTTFDEKIDVFQVIQKRQSVRKYEKGVQIPNEELEAILNAAAKAPSSWNLQHWRFLVITDEAKKKELLPIGYNQQQIVDCSAVIAVLGDVEADKEAESVYGEAVEKGLMPEKVKETLVGQIHGAYKNEGPFPRDEAVLNASLAAMQLMLAAKGKGYDTCPMGGFNRHAFVEAFKVPERFVPVMLLTLGKAQEEAHPSMRKPLSERVVYNSF
ncbi:nitroreductase family protein [Halalkalibacter urbisdiaboli]|uniref:nitroreductase family protein n=1 Tax=Halalkalibacter urbisdiaboli TaxID=1960589 RepID=UPI000B4379D5|nr:nitroreductase family protein [Halalkalibacter urbisdiaboli]